MQLKHGIGFFLKLLYWKFSEIGSLFMPWSLQEKEINCKQLTLVIGVQDHSREHRYIIAFSITWD
jgi:hypothetical protein